MTTFGGLPDDSMRRFLEQIESARRTTESIGVSPALRTAQRYQELVDALRFPAVEFARITDDFTRSVNAALGVLNTESLGMEAATSALTRRLQYPLQEALEQVTRSSRQIRQLGGTVAEQVNQAHQQIEQLQAVTELLLNHVVSAPAEEGTEVGPVAVEQDLLDQLGEWIRSLPPSWTSQEIARLVVGVFLQVVIAVSTQVYFEAERRQEEEEHREAELGGMERIEQSLEEVHSAVEALHPTPAIPNLFQLTEPRPLRVEPNKDAERLLTLQDASVVEQIDVHGKWLQVVYRHPDWYAAFTGWIYNRGLKELDLDSAGEAKVRSP